MKNMNLDAYGYLTFIPEHYLFRPTVVGVSHSVWYPR